ncbi:MAG: hypothetical protein HY823_13495 [Acidobacteria bacterium]|nr:hypothetical protein [Acidobacteriota bacterium]
MRKYLLLAVAALVAAAPAAAKMTTVKGAKCTVCHDGTPKDKKFNEKAAKMVAKYKEEQCKDCHGWADGKLTTTKKEK